MTLPLTVFTQRNFVADFLQAKCILMEIGRFAFLRPPLGNLGATYDDRLRLIGKRVVDFLLAFIELFSLGITVEALRAIIGSKQAILLQRGSVDPKISGRRGRPHQPFFFSENQAKLSFIWYINLDRSLYRLSQFTRVTDRRTDRQNSHHNTASVLHAAR